MNAYIQYQGMNCAWRERENNKYGKSSFERYRHGGIFVKPPFLIFMLSCNRQIGRPLLSSCFEKIDFLRKHVASYYTYVNSLSPVPTRRALTSKRQHARHGARPPRGVRLQVTTNRRKNSSICNTVKIVLRPASNR
jgi:hypothetical protein